MSLLVDTNILVRLKEPDSPHHDVCVRAMRMAETVTPQWNICAQVLIEFWVVATRPRAANGLGLSPEAARADIDDFGVLLACLPEPPDLLQRWKDLVTNHQVLGRQAHDTRLVALMQAHGIARLLTLNERDFRRFGAIVCVTPAQLLAESTR